MKREILNPDERVKCIEDSLRCYVGGWLSLIPLLGVPMLVVTLIRFHRVRVMTADFWNPARRYLNWGVIIAALGGLISCLLYGIIFVVVMKSLEN